LKADGVKSSDEENGVDPDAQAQLPGGAKLSNFLVSPENIERMNKHLQNSKKQSPNPNLTMEDVRARITS
jgi:hypothetical protein